LRFIRINQFFLDIQTHRFVEAGNSSPMDPKLYALLRMFCNHPQKTLSIEAIKKAVWRGKFVDDEVVYEAIAELKFMLNDDSESYQIIKTHQGRGYELAADISWYTQIADAEVEESNIKKQQIYSKIWKLQMVSIAFLAFTLLVILYIK
jgi:DNA-binding winged helix-turn-helix (wHTH) protein